MKFKPGDICYFVDEEEEGFKFNLGPIIFYGTGKESAKLYPKYSTFRKQCDYVVMWDVDSWMPADKVRKLTKLERALK